MRNTQAAVTGVGDDQHEQRPDQQGRNGPRHGKKEQRESACQEHRGKRPEQQDGARRAGKKAVTAAANQRVDERVKQARSQQDQAQRGQRDAERAGIVVWQHDVQRKRHKRERHAEQTVRQALP